MTDEEFREFVTVDLGQSICIECGGWGAFPACEPCPVCEDRAFMAALRAEERCDEIEDAA